MFNVSSFTGVSLVLLLPTAFLWIAVVLQEQFGLEQPLKMLTNSAPDIIFVGLALLLPFVSISFGLWEWNSGGETGSLMAALIAVLFLSFALIATVLPKEDKAPNGPRSLEP